MKSFFTKTSLLIFFSFSSFAQNSNSLLNSSWQEKFQDWTLFKSNRGDQIICYLASTPIKNISSFKNRGEPFFLVTNIENDADEISASSGFIFKSNSDVEVSFRSKKFYLFPYKTLAWAHEKSSDINIIKEMQKNADMVVSSVASNGKIAIDTYSLIGFTQSYQKLRKICK
ncbi:MAG: hypothetical protein KGP29_06510 [Proteobacteria bacterium]|nr:hypothetical protein [Pseudomonadota bacterium]